VDLVHSLASTSPAFGRFGRVVTVHDLIYLVYPEAHRGVLSLGMRMLVPLGVRRADRVIAISRSTRDDLVTRLGVPPEKIDVVPNGVGTRRGNASDEAALRVRMALGDRRVALSVSAKRPHKNLMRLLEALSHMEASRRPVLVLPGYPTPHEDELKARASDLGLHGDVRFPAWVSADDLEGLYELAACFVFPSLYEGFGLPVLEAMARGVPVACSDRGSLREVAGSAALVFDPEDPRDIAAAILRLLEDPAEASRLRRAGRERARRFSWSQTARGVLDTYERVLRPGS
ncbi:MAG: glycosyltransferase family 4 protein, partial [Actinomycetota bacterium]|nr:glycosyltransferase family 4 protein [Actinomycetota bacterium]